MTRILGVVVSYAALTVAGGEGLSAQEDTSNLLRPGDELSVRVWPDTTLTGRYRVESDGRTYLPMVGPIQVTGQSIERLRTELIERYSQVMRSPVVVVVPRFRVSILGAVRSPGLYFVEPPISVIDVISMAGGFTDNADTARLRLLRRGQVFGVDAETALETGAQTAAVPLESGDRVVVPVRREISFLQVFQTLVSVVTLAVTLSTL